MRLSSQDVADVRIAMDSISSTYRRLLFQQQNFYYFSNSIFNELHLSLICIEVFLHSSAWNDFHLDAEWDDKKMQNDYQFRNLIEH
jgi:hypothetical protein